MHQGPYTDGHFFIPTFSYFTIFYVHTLLYILLRDHWAGKCVTDPGLTNILLGRKMWPRK